MTTATAQTVPLAKLTLSPANVGKTGRDAGIKELAENIHAEGLLQNLGVCERGGKYEVVIGGRRLAALKLLVRSKRLPKNWPVPVVILAEDEATAASLSENAMRQDMHPADQFEAFAALIDQGKAVEDVAARYGVTPAVVARRLKLARVAPSILAAYRADKLALEQVMGFTVTDIHAEQERVLALIEGRPLIGREQIVRMLTQDKLPISDPAFLFVGEQAYLEAGGSVSRDLFDDRTGGYADDSALIERLATERLAAMLPETLALGWKWAEVRVDLDYDTTRKFARIHARPVPLSADDQARIDALTEEYDALAEDGDPSPEDQARLDALDVEIDALQDRTRAYDPEEMSLAGGWLTIDDRGAAKFDGGYVRPEDQAALDALLRRREGRSDAKDEADDGADHGQSDAATTAAATGPSLSDALLTDLHAARTIALRIELTTRPDVALRALAHSLAVSQFGSGSAALTVHPARTFIPAAQRTHCPDEAPVNDRLGHWSLRLPQQSAALWDAIMALADEDVLDLIAALTAPLVDATFAKALCGNPARPGPCSDKLATCLDLDMRKHWTPTAESYFGRVSKEMIRAAVTEAAGSDEADKLAGLKKGPMAEAAAKAVADTTWLPQPLRTTEG